MYRAIGFAFIVLLAPGMSNAQELGASVFGGYSIPGDSRSLCSSGSVSDGVRPSAQINFHRMQAGLVIAGDLFFRIEPADMGIGTVMFSRGGISGSLLSTKARREEVNARDFKRSFRAAFVFFRWRAITESSLVPYLGAGIGIFGLREREPYEHSNWENGPFLQIFAGGEARITESSSRVFTEIRLNLAEFADNPEPGRDIVKCCGWNMAFVSWTVAIGLRFAY